MAALRALGVRDLQLTNAKGMVSAQLDDSAKAALRRVQERARVAGVDLVQLLLTGDIQQWEQLITRNVVSGAESRGA
jgi:aryl carrier-like protein